MSGERSLWLDILGALLNYSEVLLQLANTFSYGFAVQSLNFSFISKGW